MAIRLADDTSIAGPFPSWQLDFHQQAGVGIARQEPAFVQLHGPPCDRKSQAGAAEAARGAPFSSAGVHVSEVLVVFGPAHHPVSRLDLHPPRPPTFILCDWRDWIDVLTPTALVRKRAMVMDITVDVQLENLAVNPHAPDPFAQIMQVWLSEGQSSDIFLGRYRLS